MREHNAETVTSIVNIKFYIRIGGEVVSFYISEQFCDQLFITFWLVLHCSHRGGETYINTTDWKMIAEEEKRRSKRYFWANNVDTVSVLVIYAVC